MGHRYLAVVYWTVGDGFTYIQNNWHCHLFFFMHRREYKLSNMDVEGFGERVFFVPTLVVCEYPSNS